MDSPSLHPSSPSCATPLYPVSPDRTNRQVAVQSPSCLSPRLRNDPFFSSPHRSSDVQNKVSQFNQLAENMSPKRKDNEAALRRAVLGREEAEAKMKGLDDENMVLKRSVEEGRARERKIAQRVETMMEDVQRHKESGIRAQTVYEKEIRRARKEAFKSSSALVKLQEELKTARNRYTLMREEVDVQKRKVEEREQETFSAQYKMISYQEELDSLQQRLKLVEQERDALRTSLKEEEVARIAAEGRIPLPAPTEDDELESPRRSTSLAPSRTLAREEAILALPQNHRDEQIEGLELELKLEQRLRQEAQETVTFMKLECQLQACSCRRAEQEGNSYVYDQQLHALWLSPQRQSPTLSTREVRAPTPEESVIIHPAANMEPLIDFSPAASMHEQLPTIEKPTFHLNFEVSPSHDQENIAPAVEEPPILSPPLEPPFLAPPLPPTALSESPSLLSLPGRSSDECRFLPSVSAPATPRQQQLGAIARPRTAPRNAEATPKLTKPGLGSGPHRALPAKVTQEQDRALRLITNTTTTKIPLADPDEKGSVTAPAKFPFSPGATKTREEALRSIQKWREGRPRNRSVTTGNTTQRRPVSGSPVRRDISAPERRVVS